MDDAVDNGNSFYLILCELIFQDVLYIWMVFTLELCWAFFWIERYLTVLLFRGGSCVTVFDYHPCLYMPLVCWRECFESCWNVIDVGIMTCISPPLPFNFKWHLEIDG